MHWPVIANDELQVKTLQFTAGKTYTFKINAANFPEDMQAYLIDQHAGTETQLSLSGATTVNFATTVQAGSYGSDRFRVVFRSTTLGNGQWNSNTVKVYPNPIQNNQFNIALPNNVAGKVAITLYNLVGQEIYKTNVESSNIITVNPSLQLSKGIYILQVSNGTASVKQKIAVK
ncbi:T9SS type A sorting domain-containing protein [Flavobacterium lindanitolerans]|nr:T9SS type A sorting domain-containing protein [Flavobacterium lindanitolerans]